MYLAAGVVTNSGNPQSRSTVICCVSHITSGDGNFRPQSDQGYPDHRDCSDEVVAVEEWTSDRCDHCSVPGDCKWLNDEEKLTNFKWICYFKTNQSIKSIKTLACAVVNTYKKYVTTIFKINLNKSFSFVGLLFQNYTKCYFYRTISAPDLSHQKLL